MKLLVCGGRNYLRGDVVFWTLDRAHAHRTISLLIHGGADGADTLAGAWAMERGIPCEIYPANWHRDGKAAGPIRNQYMLEQARPDGVLAFPGGRGTADMVKRARAAGVLVWMPYGA